MMPRPSNACLRALHCGLLLLALASLPASADAPKRVLILDPFGLDIAPYSIASSAFREALVHELGEPVDYFEVSLDLARFASPEDEGPFVEFLGKRFDDKPVDLVVPIGTAATVFAARHREDLFSETPMLVLASATRGVPEGLKEHAAFVIHNVDLPGMVEDILAIQPETSRIVVLFGDSGLERYWMDECRREFQAFTNRLNFTWLNGVPFEQALEHCAALPPHAFILHTLYVVDSSGVPFESHEALRRLHEVANAPIFGYFESHLGLGAIGGRLYQDRKTGKRAGQVAARILRGEPAGDLPPVHLEASEPMFDSRELKRWGIKESALPAGSIVRFHELTFWQSYRKHITVAVLLCLAQSVLIVGLLVNRTTRQRAEAAARDLRGRLLRAREEERARLARELHDDLSQRLARLAIDVGQLERGTAQEATTGVTMRSVHEGLVGLSEDTHELSYRLHPSVLEELGLVEALRAECERFSRREPITAHVALQELNTEVAPEAALGLFRVAQEALGNVARHAQAHNVEISMTALGDRLQLAVTDDGIGFDVEPDRPTPTLGLAGMRERVALLQGGLNIESAPGKGTTVTAWIPLRSESP